MTYLLLQQVLQAVHRIGAHLGVHKFCNKYTLIYKFTCLVLYISFRMQIHGYISKFRRKKFHYISHNSGLRDIKNQILYTSIQQFINKIEIDFDV